MQGEQKTAPELDLLLILQVLEHFGSIFLQGSALEGGFNKAEVNGWAVLCGCCEQHCSHHQCEIAMGGQLRGECGLMPQKESLATIKLQVLLGFSERSIIIHVSTGPVRFPLPQKLMI